MSKNVAAEAVGTVPGGSATVAVPDFLRPLIHDIRSPLMAAQNVIETLRTGDLTHEQRDRLAEVGACLAVIDDTAMRVFALERLEDELAFDPVTEVDVGEVVAEAIFESDPPVVPKLDVEPGSHLVIGHRRALQKAVHELLRNAIDHTPLETAVEVQVHAEGSAIVIAVEDEGPGVPDHVREEIFAPFNRGAAATQRGGLGLGLAIVARAAAVHGGRAWVEDRPGGGVSFRIAVPKRDPSSDVADGMVG